MEIFLEAKDEGGFGLTGSLGTGQMLLLGHWVSGSALLFAGIVMVLLALQASPGDFEQPRLEGLDIHQR